MNVRLYFFWSPQWGTAYAKSKDQSVENPEIKGFPFKTWSRSVKAMHDTSTAKDFFLVNFYPPEPFTCIFSKSSPDFFPYWLWLTPVPVWARRMKQVTLLVVADNFCRFPSWVPAECKWVPKHVLLFFWDGISKLWIWFCLSERGRCVLWNIKCIVVYEIWHVMCCVGSRELWFEETKITI